MKENRSELDFSKNVQLSESGEHINETMKEETSIMKITLNFQNPVQGNATQQHFTKEWRNEK